MNKYTRILIALFCCSLSLSCDVGGPKPYVDLFDSCGWVAELTDILETPVEERLLRKTNMHDFRFASVANGLGPAYPGFDSLEERKCLIDKRLFELIPAGADSIECERQIELADLAVEYARDYNQLLRLELIRNGKYRCAL